MFIIVTQMPFDKPFAVNLDNIVWVTSTDTGAALIHDTNSPAIQIKESYEDIIETLRLYKAVHDARD